MPQALLKYLFFGLSQVLAFSLTAQINQPPPVTASFSSVSLDDALDFLRESYDLKLSYPATLTEGKMVDCQFDKADWARVKACLFTQNGIQAEVIEGGYILLTPSPEQPPANYELCFRVVDEQGGPLPYLTAHNLGRKLSLVSDADGWIRAKVMAVATDALELSYLGFAKRQIVIGDEVAQSCSTLTLGNAGVDLTSIVVREYLTDGISATAAGRPIVLQPNKIPALPGFAENAVYRSVLLLPGINATDETAGGLRIRGGNRDQNLLLWDGIPVYSPGHYFGMISLFSPKLVDEIRVWRGPGEAAYGGYLSGIVQLQTSRELTETLRVGAASNLTHGEAYVQAPFLGNTADIQLAYRTSSLGFLEGPTYNSYREQVFQGTALEAFSEFEDIEFDSLPEAEQAYQFSELNGRILWQPDDRRKIQLSGFRQADDFTFALEDELLGSAFFDQVNETNFGLGLRYEEQFSDKSLLTIQAAYSDYGYVSTNGFTEGSSIFSSERTSGIQDASLKIAGRFALGESGQLEVGGQGRIQEAFFEFAEQDSLENFDVIGEEIGTGEQLALFGTYFWRPESAWSGEMGVRLAYYVPLAEFYPAPRLNLRYQLNADWLFKFTYGENQQFTSQLVELDFNQLGTPRPLWVLAEEDFLTVPRSREASVGAVWRRRGWLLDVDLYYKKIEDLSALSILQNTALEELDFEAGTSRAMGLELLLKKRVNKWRSWIIYTLSTTDLQFDNISPAYFPAFNDQRHQLKWVNTFQAGPWLFSLGWRINSGARFSPVASFSIEEDDEDEDDFEIDVELAGFNTGRLAPYHRLDGSVFYQYEPTGRGLAAKIGFSLLNIYGRDNPIGGSYLLREDLSDEIEDSDFLIDEISKSGLGLTPNISISLSWR